MTVTGCLSFEYLPDASKRTKQWRYMSALRTVSGHLATRESRHQPTRHHETISPPANSPPSEVFSDKSRRNSCSGTIIFIDSLVCMHITTFTEEMSRELTDGIFETRCVVLVISRARNCKLSVRNRKLAGWN